MTKVAQPEFIESTAGRVADDAPMSPGDRRPLILLSHGTGGSALQLAWLGITLAEFLRRRTR